MNLLAGCNIDLLSLHDVQVTKVSFQIRSSALLEIVDCLSDLLIDRLQLFSRSLLDLRTSGKSRGHVKPLQEEPVS